MASLTYVGGTEIYTENETRNVEVSLGSSPDTDYFDELVSLPDYSPEGSFHAGYATVDNHIDLQNLKYAIQVLYQVTSGSSKSTSITFRKALTNVRVRLYWENINVGGTETNVTDTISVIYKGNTVLEKTGTIESIGDTKDEEGLGILKAEHIIENVAEGDVLTCTCTRTGTTTNSNGRLRTGYQVWLASDPITFTETVPVQKTRGVNKPVSSIYAGVTATVPVYTETTTTEDVALSANTFTDFFSADNTGTTGTNAKGITWADNSGGGLKLTFGNYGIDSSTSMTTFTAQRDLTNVVIKGLYYTESNYDKITLTVAGTTVLNAVSGTSSTLTQRWTGSLSKGQTIVLKYVKDSSQSATNESSTYFTLSCDPYQKTVTTQTQTGTETKLVDKKIVKGYVGGPDGKARLFFGGGGFSYTGEYTEQNYTSSNGTKHKLYTLTTGGEMKLTQEAGYWMCGAGCSGEANRRTTSSKPYTYESGKGGCGGHVASGTMLPGTWQVLIGAGGDTSKNGAEANSGGNTSITFGSTTTTAEGGNIVSGGSGGGSATSYRYSVSQRNGGSGDGVSTIPFGLTSLGKASPGGGGGGFYVDESRKRNGGAGGSNGEDGGDTSTGDGDGGAGGEEGGGRGGNRSLSTSESGRAATFYGGAGGGGAAGGCSWAATNGGAGYQGVVYIAIPPITTT